MTLEIVTVTRRKSASTTLVSEEYLILAEVADDSNLFLALGPDGVLYTLEIVEGQGTSPMPVKLTADPSGYAALAENDLRQAAAHVLTNDTDDWPATFMYMVASGLAGEMTYEELRDLA